MMLNIFKKNKKQQSAPANKEFLDGSNSYLFLEPVHILKKYITEYYPIEKNEWLATNTVNIYKHLSELNSAIFIYCNDESCPHILIGSAVLSWTDDKNKKNKVSATYYITLS
ncbi:hypothetical protein MXB_1127, partial [Myxobolus squamalis]